MRGKIPKSILFGMLAIGMVGCGAPATTSFSADAPAGAAAADIPTLKLSDNISPSEMVDGLDQDLNNGQEVQQRWRRPSVRWRRTIWGGTPYYVPYNYYWWAPRPYYQPYFSGPVWWGYSRPGFRHSRVRFRRW